MAPKSEVPQFFPHHPSLPAYELSVCYVWYLLKLKFLQVTLHIDDPARPCLIISAYEAKFSRVFAFLSL